VSGCSVLALPIANVECVDAVAMLGSGGRSDGELPQNGGSPKGLQKNIASSTVNVH